MTMAKAITNGVVPLGAVASREHIYDTMLDASPTGAIEFFMVILILLYLFLWQQV